MQITLTAEEVELLRELLKAEFDQFPAEIHHTATHDGKHVLKDRRVIVEGLLARIEGGS